VSKESDVENDIGYQDIVNMVSEAKRRMADLPHTALVDGKELNHDQLRLVAMIQAVVGGMNRMGHLKTVPRIRFTEKRNGPPKYKSE
jgi:hypothetical protein